MIKAGGAFAVYIALMGAYLGDFSALSFALVSAVLLCLSLSLHHVGLVSAQPKKEYQALQSVLPSVSESMAELHVLQKEINELQAQFAAENAAQGNRSLPNGSGS